MPGLTAAIFLASASATDMSCWPLSVIIEVSDVEDPGVARLDRVTAVFDCSSVILHGFDVFQRLAAGFLLRLRMHRAQPTDIDDELLRLAAETERLKQLGRVRVGRTLEDA